MKMEVKDVRDFWEKRLPLAIERFPETVKEAANKYSVHITDYEDGSTGHYVIDSNGPNGPVCRLAEGPEEDGDTIQTMSAETFATLYNQPQLGMAKYFTGALKVEKNQLKSLLSYSVWTLVEKL